MWINTDTPAEHVQEWEVAALHMGYTIKKWLSDDGHIHTALINENEE